MTKSSATEQTDSQPAGTDTETSTVTPNDVAQAAPSTTPPPTSAAQSTASAQETTPEAPTQEAPLEVPGAAFAAFGLGPQTLRAIIEHGFTTPTPVQQQTIPLLLSGRDVVAQAPTGTGKTAAYGLPIIERLNEDELRPQALIVAPTRELAIQVSEAMHALGKYREVVTLPIYGGQPYDRQLRALARGVQVVVGTPGRLLDHVRRRTLDLSNVRMVVLDEADEMLSMGFIEDIEAILSELPETRQGALFSATIPPRIARLAEQYLRQPEQVRVTPREAIAPRVRQVYYEVPGTAKMEALTRVLDLEEPDSAIVFVRTRNDADVVSEQLNGQGYLAQAIHGEISQSQRERTLDRFRKGHTQLLVATDVAARGLDIPDVSHVINYDLPVDAESYVHRIGRTGRAGRAGEALTLVTPRERRQLRYIEDAIHRRLERLRLPTPADVASRRRAAFREDLLHILDDGQLDPFLTLVEDLVGNHEPAALAAAAFKMAAQAREAVHPSRVGPWFNVPVGAEAQPEEPTDSPERDGRRRRPNDRDESFGETSESFDTRRSFARPRRERQPQVEGPMARLFLRVGRRDGARPADLVGAIANEAHVSSEVIGDIDLYDTFSFVEVGEEHANVVLAALNRTTIRGRAVRASIARPGDEWTQRDGEDSEPSRPTGRDSRDGRDSHSPRGPRAPRDEVGPRRYGLDDEGERRPLRIPYAARRAGGSARKTSGRDEQHADSRKEARKGIRK